jgi:putative membrane protein
MKVEQLGPALISSASFAALGVALFAILIWIIAKVTPLRREIEEEHNTAFAIVVAALILGLSMIVSAAISG